MHQNIDPHDEIVWGPNGGRASDVPVKEQGGPNALFDGPPDGFETAPLTNGPSDWMSPEKIIAQRLKLLANGYKAVPVTGKRPPMDGWQNVCHTAAEYEIRTWSSRYPASANTGILGGTVVGVDIDVLDEELSQYVAARAQVILGKSTLRRVGRAPKQLFCYRVEAPIKKLQTPDLYVDDETKHKVEVLAEGQQFVALGMHPDTGQLYHWPENSPLDTRADELPLVTQEALAAFVAEAEALIRAAGGRTKSERKDAAKETATKGPYRNN
jgi:putative DNA primase/helicase